MKHTVIILALSLALPLATSSGDETNSHPTRVTSANNDESTANSAPDQVRDCFITTVTSDVDGPIPTATFWGRFCDSPTVSVGQPDGSLPAALVLSSSRDFVTVDLTGNADPMDTLFRVECPREVCEWKLTVGAVGPTGPSGPAGPDDPDLLELKDQVCAMSAQLGLPLPSFCPSCPCFDAADLVDLLTGHAITCFFDDVNSSLLFGDTGQDTLAALHVVPVLSCIWWLNDEVISSSQLTDAEVAKCEAEIRTAAAQLGESCPDIP